METIFNTRGETQEEYFGVSLKKEKGKGKKEKGKEKKENKIISLLGGNDFDSSFLNGEGFYIIKDHDFKKAQRKIDELKKEIGLESYHIESRIASENIYLKTISNIMSCIYQNKNMKYIRVGQICFRNNVGSEI